MTWTGLLSWLDILLDPIIGDMSVIEMIWLISNIAGIVASLMATMLALADRRRTRVRRKIGAIGAGGQDWRFKEWLALVILGDAAASAELVKAIIHTGHGVIGVIVSVTPDPVRPSLSFALMAVSIWMISSSWLLMASTLLSIKARYDYRAARKSGRYSTWSAALWSAFSEVRHEMARTPARSGRRAAPNRREDA